MVKLMSFFKRKQGMSVDAFQAYWRTRHAEVVVKLPGIRRYVQSHTLPSGYRKGEPVYDGVAEVWVDDTHVMRAQAGTPEYAAVRADEPNFMDVSSLGAIITEEHVSILAFNDVEVGVTIPVHVREGHAMELAVEVRMVEMFQYIRTNHERIALIRKRQ